VKDASGEMYSLSHYPEPKMHIAIRQTEDKTLSIISNDESRDVRVAEQRDVYALGLRMTNRVL